MGTFKVLSDYNSLNLTIFLDERSSSRQQNDNYFSHAFIKDIDILRFVLSSAINNSTKFTIKNHPLINIPASSCGEYLLVLLSNLNQKFSYNLPTLLRYRDAKTVSTW